MKKTNKQITVLAQAMLCIAAIITLALTLATCKDDNPPPPEDTPCNCATTYGRLDHLGIDEQCTCSATVHPCGCTEQTATIEGTSIIIRKEAGVTVLQMNTAVALVQKAYDDYIKGSPVADTSFKNKVTEIHIVSGNSLTRDSGIVKVGIADELEDVGFYLEDIASGAA